MGSTEQTNESTHDRLDRPVLLLVLVLVLGAWLALVNTTIVGVALPQIGDQLGAGLTVLTWVGTGYLIATAVAIPLSSWAVVRAGLRPTWFVALGLFAAGSALAALAPGSGVLAAARVVQGLGGGMLEPVMLIAVAQAAGPRRMGRAMGLVAGAVAIAPLAGPVLGGIVVQDLGWRWMFGLFVPLSLLALAASARLLPTGERVRRQLDLPGLVLLGSASTAVLVGLSQGSRGTGIQLGGWIALALGLVLFAAYVAWAARLGERAIVDLAPLRTRGVPPAALIMMLLGAAIYPLFFGLPQFFQGVLGYGPLAAGAMLVPQGLGALAGMINGGRLSDRYGARPLVIAGSLTTAAGNLAFVLLGPDAPAWAYVVVLAGSGVGIGFVGAPTMSALYRVLEPAHIPAGSSILFVANQLGGAVGIAVIATLIGAGAQGEPAWTVADGTGPVLLPVVGALAVTALATRLPGATR